MNNKSLKLRGGAAAVVLAALAACGGSDDGATGTLLLSLTDAPACGYDKVHVTVEKIRVHRSGSAAEGEGGWSEITLAAPKRIDLLSLTNGALEDLGQVSLPAGRYTQLRLVLAENRGATPLANAVLPSGSTTEVPLATPSAQQSGLKVKVDMDVAAGRTSGFVIDFDACKSIVATGAGGYLLKPVLRVMARTANGVSGVVEPAIANGSTTVSLQKDGVAVRSTVPAADGRFLLQPVEPGTYTLVLTAPDRATAVVRNVVVTADAVVTLNNSAPLALDTSASGTLSGTVTTGTTPVDATVRALQALTGGPRIELVSRPADGATGAFSYRVPVAAPQVASYAAGGSTLTFAADSGAAGRYGLEATSGTSSKAAGPFTLGANGAATASFTFP
ncbi:DUF4382 domain-containing protein [Ramlibacter tataouinensis]|uniref:DUF4382 domain-containing protein n=1 Tax=Ramlibacter tataouinensis (strain ATCC BAA-407 / DSM 14655 / LMG 21543 / TTB310) TaxID=365046 RepID=F5Y3Y5_RAMTT|nr:DUF4382 domain-containing protein [Ramlibacter tataouinensis]AEG91263.1 Conserved hypothetical protein [Ramlibacter tataouinensis TTB310]